MTVKSHRIHGKSVSSSQEFQTVLRISERTRETGIENHPVDWTTERSLVTYLSAGSVEETGRKPDLRKWSH